MLNCMDLLVLPGRLTFTEDFYLGHVAVEATLLGLVLGATFSVSLGLFTVALCHYLGVARLMLALSSTEPSSYVSRVTLTVISASGCIREWSCRSQHLHAHEAY